MWSQPDIRRINAQAEAHKPDYDKAVHTKELDGVPIECEVCSWHSKETPADYVYEWHDIFSADPKGVIGVCERHDGSTGNPLEGYFTCDRCSKVFIENYTWEYYFTSDPDNGEIYCLPCAATMAVNDPNNWIELTDERIDSLTFKDVRKAKHLIGVDMPTPAGIEFYKNVEFDSMSGEKLYSTQQAGVDELKDHLRDAKADGHTMAMLILDSAYQFAVSIGVYLPTPSLAERLKTEEVAA